MLRKMLGLTTLVLALSACTTPIQMAYDAEVDRLCAIDGGMKIYESVQLPPDRFDHDIFIRKNSPEFKITQESAYLKGTKDSSIRLRRYSTKVIRIEDEKLLGAWVYYYRGGGDIIPSDGDSSYSCPQGDQGSQSIFFKTLFIKKQ